MDYSSVIYKDNYVVLEGVKNFNIKQVVECGQCFRFDKISDTDNRVDYTNRPVSECLSPLGLLQWSDGYTYAFSNRLVEYLLLNVIDSQESINKNIERVQDRITSYKMGNRNLFPKYRGAFTPGVWDENIQKYIYSLRKSIEKSPRGNSSVDYNGYVDRDTETILDRGNK